jgi:hypothetical protein
MRKVRELFRQYDAYAISTEELHSGLREIFGVPRRMDLEPEDKPVTPGEHYLDAEGLVSVEVEDGTGDAWVHVYPEYVGKWSDGAPDSVSIPKAHIAAVARHLFNLVLED